MPAKDFKVKPNSFYVENQVSLGAPIYSRIPDLSASKNDEIYTLKTSPNPNYLLLSGNVIASEHIEQGDYALQGGFLRTHVSGVNLTQGDRESPTLQVYGLEPNTPLAEGGMKISRKTIAGTVEVTNSSNAVVGTATDFSGSTGAFGDYFEGANYLGGLEVWLGPAGSRKKYTVDAIASDTALSLTTEYTGSTELTSELQINEEIGSTITNYVSAYTPSVNFNEDFDGAGTELESYTTMEREGANAVVKKGYPYVNNSEWSLWRWEVRDESSNNKVSQKKVKEIMEEHSYYPATINGQQTYVGTSLTSIDSVNRMAVAYSTDATVRGDQVANWEEGIPYVPGFSKGRLYLRYSMGSTGWFMGGNYRLKILDRFGKPSGYYLGLGSIDKYRTLPSYVRYETTQTFDPNPENTTTTTKNNTIFDKVYTSMLFENPFTATTEVPIVDSRIELQSDVVNGGANAARIYHLWDYSPDNPDVQKYFGRDNSINPQTAYLAKYDLPFPLVQDFSNTDKLGDRRTYLPYVSMDMNISKLSPSVLFDIETYWAQFGTGSFINDPTVQYSGSGASATDLGGNSKWGTSAQRQRTETFLRSVVVTFSNYKPLDTHTTLEEFLQYGFDNAYGSDQNAESIVGGVVFSRLGMDGADIDNDFVYAQALPIVEANSAQMSNPWNDSVSQFGLAKLVSGTGEGRLQQMIMRPTDISNTANPPASTPRVVKLPYNSFFNMKFFIDTQATQSGLINTRQPYADFPSSSQGVGMRCVFDVDAVQSGSTDEDIYTNMPYLDLNFCVSGGNSSPGQGTGGTTPSLSFDDIFLSPERVKYPKHMIVWVQNYRFIKSAENYWSFGDNAIIDEAEGAAIEAEVYIDNVMGVDFYRNPTNSTVSTTLNSPITFKQNTTAASPLRTLEVGFIDLTSFNPGSGTTETDFTNCDTSMIERSVASSWCIGFDDKINLPISGSSTRRSGYILLNDFYTADFANLDQIVPDLYSGAMISLLSGSGSGGPMSDASDLGRQLAGSNYASGTVGTHYYDAAVGNNQYSTTGGADVVTKINIGTGSSNNFLSTDGFTQKGFMNVYIDNNGNSTSDAYDSWGKREHALTSTKVLDVPRAFNELQTNQIMVDAVNIFNAGHKDDEYILYKAQSGAGDTNYKIVTLKDGVDSIDNASGIVTFNEDITFANTASNALGVETNLSVLYISPYKYWITLNTSSDQGFSNRSYSSMCLVNNNLSGATASHSNLTGTTFNESLYTFIAGETGSIGASAPYDRPVNFIFDTEDETTVQLNYDYGYGPYSPETKTGGNVATSILRTNEYNYSNISNLLISSTVQEDSTYGLVLRMKPNTYQNKVILYGDEYTGSNNQQFKPTYIYEYLDPLPSARNLTVQPVSNLLEEGTNLYDLTTQNLTSLRFNWETEGEDIWYQLLCIDNNNRIDNKYTNSQLWLPMNEEPPTLQSAPSFTAYRPNNDTSQAATVGANVRSFVDGIQGYSPLISGNAVGTASVTVPTTAANRVFHDLSEYTFVVHVTFDSTMAGSACRILSQGQPVSEYIYLGKDANDNIIYLHHGGSGTVLSGTQFIKCDGKTAYSIIVTYKYQSESGPDLQLFVNGKLDGYQTDASEAIDNTGDDFEIGTHSHGGVGGYFKGRVEEFVLYDKLYHVPNGNEYILNTADLEDLDALGTSALIWNAKVYTFDYHNIRGKTYREVASTNNITWRATTV